MSSEMSDIRNTISLSCMSHKKFKIQVVNQRAKRK